MKYVSKYKNMLIFRCYFPRKAHSTEQIPFMRVFPSGTHHTAETTEAMRIKCLAQGHITLMLPGLNRRLL